MKQCARRLIKVKRTYLIDVENIARFMKEDTRLTSADKIVVFLAVKQYKNLPKYTQELLDGTEADYEVVEIHTHDKNAMDINICTYISVLLGKGKTDTEYYIVSKDKGYDKAINFIKNKMGVICKVRRISLVDHVLAEDDGISEIKELLENKYTKNCVSKVIKCYEGSKDLKSYNEALVKALPKDAAEIYKTTRYILRKREKIK